ncbi:MAG: class I SAM-dependent methyltransferase [Acidobacteria bacterium]|nr:class I SAM-dependent methyltransferase [Acidobacteriota bacterium]
MGAESEPRRSPALEDFLETPTRRLADWHWLWKGDHRFPIRSHRGFWGRLLVAGKRLLRPFVTVPQNDLWERQRVFNTVLLEYLMDLEARAREERHEHRIRHLEAFMDEGLKEVARHNDALFARVDQKMDRYRRQASELMESLGAALAVAEQGGAPTAAPLVRAREELSYLELERRYRGTAEEIENRLGVYLDRLEGQAPILDLGCGRGEALELFGSRGWEARGVDGSAKMVQECRSRGLDATEGDLFEYLADAEPSSFGAVVSFHVIEHLPVGSLDRLVRLAFRALRPGGLLVLETPNPLSVVVAARNFWLDPTHLRPVHPETLRLFYDLAGFDGVDFLLLRPFAPEERLPELDLSGLPAIQHDLADRVNRLRDRLDDLLFGEQDYALIGRRPT